MSSNEFNATSFWQNYQKTEAARTAFATKYPTFYENFMECHKSGAMLDIVIWCRGCNNGYVSMGMKGTTVYRADHGIALDIMDLWSSRDGDHWTHYDVSDGGVEYLWDAAGNPNPDLGEASIQSGPEKFPYKEFFALVESDGCNYIEHPGPKGIGEEIYAKISKVIKAGHRYHSEGRAFTPKQTLEKISEIIAEVTNNPNVKVSFQDASDYGFTDSDSD